MSLIETNNKDKKKSEERGKIVRYLKFIFNFVAKICQDIFETYKNLRDIIQENDLLPLKEIIPQKSRIMKITSFDKTEEYYSYIIPVFKNNIIEIKSSASALNLKKYLLKDLIDICNLINKIIDKNENSIEDNAIKFYIFHIINVFNDDDNKMESSKIFFKMGQIILSDKYEIYCNNKFFPEDTKKREYNEFLKLIIDLLKEYQNIYNDVIKDDLELLVENLYSQIRKIINEIEKEMEINNQTSKSSIIAKILLELDSLFLSAYKIKKLRPYKDLIDILCSIFIEMNEYDISYTLCFIGVNVDKKSLEQKKKECSKLSENCKEYNEKYFNQMVLYLFKFLKYNELKSVLSNKDSSLAQEYKVIIKDKNFQNKITNFFKSNSVKSFIEKKLEERIFTQIKTKYNDFLDLLQKQDFWDSIMFFTLPKYIKGFISSYMRIVINDNYVIVNNCNSKEDKNDMIEFLLFEVIIHELLHLLRRYYLIGEESKHALTPPGSEESKKNGKKGEIGETLIKYFFGVKRINFLTLRQAQKYKDLTFENEEDIKKLKDIIALDEVPDKKSTYIKFVFSTCDLSNETYIRSFGACLLSYSD